MKDSIKHWLHADIRLPDAILTCIRALYKTGVVAREALQAFYAVLIVKPVMQAISQGGRRLRVEQIPYVRGQGEWYLGKDVYLSGKIGVSFSKREDVGMTPRLVIGDRTFVGHQCHFALSKHISIGTDCLIAAGTRIQDHDGHPLDPDARKRHEKPPVDGVKPVTIGHNVWIAPRCIILKGVTIGDNAVVGAGSVVCKDVVAGTLVAGVPAKEIRNLNQS